MQRSKLRRGALVASLVGAPTVGLAAWFWWIPNVVSERAVETLEARLGVSATVEDASLRWSGAVLEDVRLHGEHGGLDVAIEEVGLSGGLFAIATRGATAVDHVQARGVHFEVDLDDGGRESVAAIRTRLAPRADESDGEASTDERPSRIVEVVGARGELSDERGVLASGEVDARFENGGLTIEGREGRLGTAPSDVIEVASWSGALTDQRVLSSATIEEPTLKVGEESGRTLERLRSAIAALRAPPGNAENDEENGVPQWLARLADGAEIFIRGFTGSRETQDGERVLLRDLEAKVTRVGAEVRLQGNGTVQGGEASWDLWVNPGAARARGRLEAKRLPFDLLLPFLPELPWWRPQDGRVDAELTMEADDPAKIELTGSALVENVGLHSAEIAPSPVAGLGLEMRGSATWWPAERRLELSETFVRRGGAEVRFTGELEKTAEYYRVEVDATMPATDCNEVVGAIPGTLLADVANFEWRGAMGGHMHLDLDSRELDDTILRIRVANGCEFVTVPAVADLRRVRAPFMHRVEEPDGTVFEMTAGPGSSNWASIYAISPFMQQAVIGHEDGGFLGHGGFAVYAIRGSLVRNLEAGRYVTGASTITMQLAKNLFLHREKTLARKLQEVILTWWLESALTKQEILELYLNVIEYGPQVYGIVSAAEHYFGRDPSELSPVEAAYLACILPNPKIYQASYEDGQLTSRMRNRVERFVRHLHSRGRIDDEALAYALSELETLRFHRPGMAAQSRTIPGSAAPLPWSTGRVGDWGVEENPYDEWVDDSDEGDSADPG